MDDDRILTTSQREVLAGARRAVLATIAADGRPRLVPICFVLDPDRPVLWSPLDEKPKRTEVHGLARVRDVLRDPRVAVLVDTWDEDWSRLGWLRFDGTASLVEPGADTSEHAAVVAALREKYLPYGTQDLPGRPLIRIELERTASWSATG
jgi:PPOX class probable F420-dependent enzyme